MSVLLFTYVLLWVLVLALTAAVFLVYRQVGLMMLRETPGSGGPEPGQLAARPLLRALAQFDSVQTSSSGRPMSFVIFASEHCTACHEVLPDVIRLASEHPKAASFFVVCKPERPDGELKGVCAGLSPPLATIADPSGALVTELGIPGTPFGLLLDAKGVVLLRGVVTSRMITMVREAIADSARAVAISGERSGAYV
jgi:hypothetical protein